MTETAEADEGSRRWLLGGAGAGAGGLAAILLAACSGSHHDTTQTTTTPPVHSRDVDLLNHLLDLEHIAKPPTRSARRRGRADRGTAGVGVSVRRRG